MAVHQVDQFYVHIDNLEIDKECKGKIEEFLSEYSYSNYEFQDNDTCLVIDDVEDECSGMGLEQRIQEIVNRSKSK